MELSPEQFSSLKRVLQDPAAKVAAALNLPVTQIETILKQLEVIVRRRAVALGSEKLMVIHVPGQHSGTAWDDALISQLIRRNTKIVTVGNDGTVLSAASGPVSVVAAANKSENGPSMTVLCAAGQLCIFVDGKRRFPSA
jgi:hypothetical protein